MPTHRIAFIACASLALPSLLWQAFEMYGLSFNEQRVLFFSVIHTKPAAVIAVLLAIPFELILLCQALAGCLLPGYRTEVGLSSKAFAALTAFLCYHAIALVGYGLWSHFAEIRQPVCVVGLALLANAMWHTIAALRHASLRSVGVA